MLLFLNYPGKDLERSRWNKSEVSSEPRLEVCLLPGLFITLPIPLFLIS